MDEIFTYAYIKQYASAVYKTRGSLLYWIVLFGKVLTQMFKDIGSQVLI